VLAADHQQDLWQRHPDLKFSGVCFGHQLLCRLLGSKVQPAPSREWELAHSQIHLSDVGKKLFRTEKDTVSLHQMHQDQVAEAPTVQTAQGLLPDDARIYVWGSSDHTEIQGLYLRDRLFTTQAHLAFDENMVKHEMEMRVEKDAIKDAEHVDEARETASFAHDGEAVARAILRYFHGEDDGIP
jgi:GMP synthase-like glutamine amidotransferase